MDFREMVGNFRQALLDDFEKKLGRALTDEERADIARIRSGLMLESFDVRLTRCGSPAEAESTLKEAREVGLTYPDGDGIGEKGRA